MDTFLLYAEWLDDIEDLTDTERSELMLALFRYVNGQELPEMQRTTKLIWKSWKRAIDRNSDKWEKVKEKRSKAGQASAEKRRAEQKATNSTHVERVEHNPTNSTHVESVEQDSTNSTVNVHVNVHDNVDTNVSKEKDKKEKRARFSPPSLEEVQAYCQERQNNVDPQAFIDFYESKGWKVGGQSMKDWKASVRTWEHRKKDEAQKQKESQRAKNKFNNFQERTYDYDGLERQLMEKVRLGT